MPDAQTLQTFRQQLAEADDSARLNTIFRRAMAASGFTAYAAGYAPEPPSDNEGAAAGQPFFLMDWPKAWLELYARRGFARDDVLLVEAARSSDPFTWLEVRARHPGASKHIFTLAAEFGWRDGLAIPVHDPLGGPGETFGLVSLAAPNPVDFDRETRSAVVATALAGFATAKRLAARPDRSGGLRLSGREREALALVADGKGDEEIAAVLGVTRRTAHFHVENAKRRLGANSRAQAVAVAITNNLLDARIKPSRTDLVAI